MNKYDVEDYIIHDDLTVDAPKGIRVIGRELKYFPFKFNLIEGHFDCSQNELYTLKNGPNQTTGSFICSENKLTSLKYSPLHIGYDF